MENKNFITAYGLFTTIVVAVIGVGIFSYPREVTQFASNDGWVIAIINGVINGIFLFIIYNIFKLNKFGILTDVLNNTVGSFLGKIIMILISIGVILNIALGIRIFAEVIKVFLLPKTPIEFILVVTILSSLYLIRDGIHGLIKFNTIGFAVMFIPIILMLLFSQQIIDITNILPILRGDTKDYLEGLKYTMYTFSGFEIIYLALPLMKKKEKALGSILMATGFIVLIYCVVFILCVAAFGVNQMKILIWPTITLLKSISIPGNFIERYEGLIMILWILFYFTTLSNGFAVSSYLVKEAFTIDNVKIASFIVLPFIYIIALIPSNIAQLYKYTALTAPIIQIINIIIIPIILLIVSFIKVRRSEKVL